MKRQELNKELLKLILSESEIEILREAYKVYKGLENKELSEYLLRRMDDVTSMVTFIGLTYPEFRSEDYDALSMRLSNLSVTTDAILSGETQGRTINYLMDFNKTPHIMNSLAYLDYSRYGEIHELLKEIAENKSSDLETEGDLKIAIGSSYHVIYLKDNNKVYIYDFDANTSPKIKKSHLPRIEKQLKGEATKEQNPILQRINDEIIYQTLQLNQGRTHQGYGLIKKSEKER